MPLSLDNLDCVSVGSTISTPPSPSSPVSPSHTLHRLDRKASVRPYQSKDAYLYAMKEDLAIWFNDLYNTSLTADNLLDNLQDGTFLCLHANNVKSFIQARDGSSAVPDIIYRSPAKAGSFQARDNLANFINWVKTHLGVNDVLLFESDDLVLNKNEKHVILCLLEVARRGARYGMLAPMLVQFEQEIDALEQKIKRAQERRHSQGSMNGNEVAMVSSDTESDRASLDEWVQNVVQRCTCPKQFPLINVSRGKYRIGYTQNVVFVRILRNHVMIRVGGGWDTLEHYMDKHDPCRCLTPKKGNTTKTRRKSSTSKENNNTISREHSPSAGQRRTSDSISYEPPVLESTPTKPRRSGSAELLSSDLVITRQENGRHVIDESQASPSKSPSKKLNKSSITPQNSPSKRSNLKVSKTDTTKRSVSPSQDLVNKWKSNISPQTTKSVSQTRDRSSSRTRLSRTLPDTDTPRNRSVSRLTSTHTRTRSHSSTRSSAGLVNNSTRTRSFSRPTTPTHSRPVTPAHSRSSTPTHSRPATPTHSRPSTPSHRRQSTPTHRKYAMKTQDQLNNNDIKQTTDDDGSRLIYHASPRRDSRHHNSSLPTRIPAPLTSSNSLYSATMSPSSTHNSSMDSLMTI